MMLQALIAYAERENLGDPDFETVGVRWVISLTSDGKLAGDPIPLVENPGDKKPRPKAMPRPFTSPNELNQGTKSHLLCDTLERAVLFLAPKAADKAEYRRVQHAYFQSLLSEAGRAAPAEASKLENVRRFLNDETELVGLRDTLAAAKAKTSDNATFSVDGEILLKSEPLRQFWRERRQRQASASAARELRVCVATGQLAETLDTTEKIRGVPGGLAMGTNLISFDKDAFCSFGLEQAQNAALSATAELKVRSALNALIDKSRGQGLVFNDTVHLHWSRQALVDDPIDLLVSGDDEAVAALLDSIKTGKRYVGLDANAYYALSLSGNNSAARIAMMAMTTSSSMSLKANAPPASCRRHRNGEDTRGQTPATASPAAARANV